MEATTKALTEALATLTDPEASCDENGDALCDLAEELAKNDSFVGSLLYKLGEDLERATQLAWDDGYHLAKELARQDRAIG